MRKARGFTIIELLVVMVIVSLLVAMAAVVTRAITSQQRRSLTAARMQGVDAAIVQFVMQQRRLPCPANGTLSAGTEVFPCTTAPPDYDQSNGVVPWGTLGLSETDATDGWERRLTYRVSPELATGTAMDMSMCDPASPNPPNNPGVAVANCNLTCTAATLVVCTPPQSFLINKGLLVKTVLGARVMDPAALPPTGSAYVVISHGETGGGGFLNSGTMATTTSVDGTQEQLNYANLARRAFDSANPITSPYYVDDGISDGPGATHFDDLVSRPSVIGVITKAGLGPRQHQ